MYKFIKLYRLIKSFYHPKDLHASNLISQGKVRFLPSKWLCSQSLRQPLPNLCSLAGDMRMTCPCDMRLTCPSDILSHGKLPWGNVYSTQTILYKLWLIKPFGDCPLHLKPNCIFSLSILCRSPYGLGFILSSYRHKVLSRSFTLSSPSWELFSCWPFSGHASLETASNYGHIVVYFIFTPLSQWKWLSCSLSPAQTSSAHVWLIALNHFNFPPRPFVKNLTFSLIINNFLAHVSALGYHNLLPFRRISMFFPHKDSCLNMLCLLRVFNHIFLPRSLLPNHLNMHLPSQLTFKLWHMLYYLPLLCAQLNSTQDNSPWYRTIIIASQSHCTHTRLLLIKIMLQSNLNIILPKTESLSSSLSITNTPSWRD